MRREGGGGGGGGGAGGAPSPEGQRFHSRGLQEVHRSRPAGVRLSLEGRGQMEHSEHRRHDNDAAVRTPQSSGGDGYQFRTRRQKPPAASDDVIADQ
uniref:Uncharacterized protein n=1 Tax=Knipowitschia caucasica TaxID=637954 RepID=A0AAV2KM04_KNICA